MYLTILAHGIDLQNPASVLVQGEILNSATIEALVVQILSELKRLENEWAHYCSSSARDEDLNLDADEEDISVADVLENCVFALNSLPLEAAPIIIVVTDGVLGYPDVTEYDHLIMQLVRHDIQCHFIQV